jgi:hypothetical protein
MLETFCWDKPVFIRKSWMEPSGRQLEQKTAWQAAMVMR